jgi:hypothetical protein
LNALRSSVAVFVGGAGAVPISMQHFSGCSNDLAMSLSSSNALSCSRFCHHRHLCHHLAVLLLADLVHLFDSPLDAAKSTSSPLRYRH